MFHFTLTVFVSTFVLKVFFILLIANSDIDAIVSSAFIIFHKTVLELSVLASIHNHANVSFNQLFRYFSDSFACSFSILSKNLYSSLSAVLSVHIVVHSSQIFEKNFIVDEIDSHQSSAINSILFSNSSSFLNDSVIESSSHKFVQNSSEYNLHDS
jgi:hypothetical protein